MSNLLTEAEAAALVGWTPANLRSHRLRYQAEQIAVSLPADQAAVLQVVRSYGVGSRPSLDGYDGPELFRLRDGRWELTRMGLEVARRLHGVQRRSPPPPPVTSEHPVRYQREDVLAWLGQHKGHVQPDDLVAVTWDYRRTAEEIGIAVGTLRTLVYRAQVARRRIDAGESSPALDRAVARAPAWRWVGTRRRWDPSVVREWIDNRPRRHWTDPLALPEPDPSRGPLISEDEARARMGVQASTMVGYRYRARSALRRIAAGSPRPNDDARSRGCPPYVVQDGERLYHVADVDAWVDGKAR